MTFHNTYSTIVVLDPLAWPVIVADCNVMASVERAEVEDQAI